MKVNLKRYAVYYVSVLVAAAIIIGLLRQLASIDLATSFIPIVPAMVASMIEGQKLSREGADYPAGKAAWIAAAQMTGVALVFNILLGVLVFGALSGAGFQMNSIAIFAGFLAFYCVFWLVTNRIFLTQGYRNATATRKGG